MNNLIVTLKTVTPMFMAGADGKTPELRAPSIKGMMRFWWRAMHGHLSIEKLREEEGKLFGSSDEKIGQSSFSLRILNCNVEESKQLSYTPHHEDQYCSQNDKAKKCDYRNGSCTKAIKRSGYTGSFTIQIIPKPSADAAYIENVFKITTILGGFGKRSRRGFGSVEITKINGNDYKPDYSPDGICKILNAIVSDKFKVQRDKIIKKGNGGNDYPFIEDIQIGKGCEKYEELLRVIGKSSHDNNCVHTGFVDMVNKKRFSSPIIVSVIKDNELYKPIITSLHTVFENGTYPRGRNGCNKTSCVRSAKFISDIIKGCE